MSFRSVTAIMLAAGLLAGCEDFKRTSYQVQKELGMYPTDPPRAETPMPPPGTISQASWAAQRTATLQNSGQGNTVPVGYKEPEQPAAQSGAAGSTPVAVTPTQIAPATASAPQQRSPQPSRAATQPSVAAAPAPAAGPNPAAMTAMPAPGPVVVPPPTLPAGYTPSASVVDQPAAAADQQQMAAAAGAMPEPPMLSGSMKENAAMVAGAMGGSWKAHLASHRTESAAINEWQELLKGNAALYGQFDPLVEWTDTQRGPFARLVLVGFAERKDADAACAKIRSSTRYCASIQK